MLIGMYQFLLNILNNPFGLTTNEYIQIIPFVLGIVVGAAILIKIIRYLLKNYFTTTYSNIIGFVIGSIAAIYPGFSFDYKGLICIILLSLAFLISYKFAVTEQKDSKEHQKY
jgi:putative membrane protein